MWADLFAYCQTVHGPVHVGVAASVSGFRGATVRARAQREGWWLPYPSVVAPPGTPRSAGYQALAALARAGGPLPDAPSPAALIRWSALAAYGVGRAWPTAVEVAVSADRAPCRDGRFRPVRCRAFDDEAIRRVGDLDLPVVAATWLVRDLAGHVTAQRLTKIVIDLAQRRHLDLDALEGDLERHPRYPGRGNVVGALHRLQAAGRTDSPPELEARERLVAAGIPLDRGQVQVVCTDGHTMHFDLGSALLRLGIECDSMGFHATRRQLRNDVRRSNELALLPDGWRFVRMTVEDLGDGWPAFVALVREVMADQARRLQVHNPLDL
ncbi:MAG: hypothetical protein KG028_06830 [Actinobacteria bacterium]|jgi:hypothetical protein|nr:hypothetical protein [Actinomycetota bacterium]